MYVKSVGQILKVNAPLRIQLSDGNILKGKILSIEDNKGSIKLADGSIISAIFVSENKILKDSYIKFELKGSDGENFIVNIIPDSEKTKNEQSLNSIIRDLNIPFEDAKNIIMSLIKFNMPASNENINLLYKDISFLNTIKNMTDTEIISFLKQALNKEIGITDVEFKVAKEIFSQLKNVDTNFLSFMLENDIPQDLENILKTQTFMSNKFFFNSFIGNMDNALSQLNKNDENLLMNSLSKDLPQNITLEDIKTIISEIDKKDGDLSPKYIKLMNNKPLSPEKLLIGALIKNLSQSIGTGTNGKNIVVSSLEETINIFKENKEMFSLSSPESYNKLISNLEIFKHINDNYSLYFFNLYDGANIFKNNIIFKSKYKGSKHIDINDVKAFISVDTKNIGIIEGNLYKKNNNISISFNVDDKFVNLFKINLSTLKNTLKEIGYDIINISVEKLNIEKNILPFSDSFNESIIQEVDVKV